MLRRLHIRDFVIVDQLELEFAAGFTALTGETGAGKSILIDALSLALGGRGEAGMVRTGAERAEVSAEFELPAVSGQVLQQWLLDQDIEPHDCLLRRVLDSGGRSRAYINGTPVTLTQLRELAGFLCDIHGQHAHHGLLQLDSQRQLLDAHAGHQGLVRAVAESYRCWHELTSAWQRATEGSAALQQERETLAWQVEELQALAFDAGQWQEDNQEHQRLSHAASLIEGSAVALDLLSEGEAALLPQLEQLAGRLQQLAGFDAELRETLDLLNNGQIQLQEAVHALRHYQRRLDIEPQRLQELEARITQVMSVARKYRVTVDELPALLERHSERLQALSAQVDVAALQAQLDAAEQEYRQQAQTLSAARAQVADRLSQQVTEAMQQLALAGGRFAIALTHQGQATAHGLEGVEFQVSTNAGQPLRPLARVASGGELSRIGLAIQVIASQAAQTPTLIFDEVDVGIGGGVAEVVGRLLHELGQTRQVLCVTHLPQVAACADHQWSIAKEERGGATYSRVTLLDQTARVDELARMLGGLKITDTTRRHAAEMLGVR